MVDNLWSNVIQQVFDFSEVILASEPRYVWINNDGVEDLAEQMKKDGIPNFYDSVPEAKYKTGIRIEIFKELVASAINYNYWYGQHDIRPNGVSSTSMYDDVCAAFGDAKSHALNFESRIEKLIRILALHRYPLLEERKRHLQELCEERKGEGFVHKLYVDRSNPYDLFLDLITLFPGFGGDLFLKRASLFFIQLYRKFGWFEDTLMATMHVPADYQVPKILRHFDCIRYTDELAARIKLGVIIPKHTLEEIQIRAATVKVCTQLQYATGWTIADVDTYLWTKRKLTEEPFHLTYTTDY